jgi:hypothetical protein
MAVLPFSGREIDRVLRAGVRERRLISFKLQGLPRCLARSRATSR